MSKEVLEFHRRAFIAAFASGAMALCFPFLGIKGRHLIINPEQRNIKYLGPKCTLNQLYSAVQDAFDDLVMIEYPNAMVAHGPLYYTMVNNWKIDQESLPLLSEGCLEQGDDLYSSIVEIKHVENIEHVGMPSMRMSSLPTVRRG